MALREVTVVSAIEVLEDGQIQIRRSRRVFDGSELLAERYHRVVLEPGQNVSTFPQRVQAICSVVWTQVVIDAYRAAKEQS